MIPTNLRPSDFKVIQIPDTTHFYFEHKFTKKFAEYALCLEPCMNGYCVAIYDMENDLVCDKECTRAINPLHMFEAMQFVSRYLNKFLMS